MIFPALLMKKHWVAFLMLVCGCAEFAEGSSNGKALNPHDPGTQRFSM